MDIIYITKPLFILLPTLLLSWQLFTYFLKKKIQLSSILDIAITGIGVLGHTLAITVILLNNGTLSDVLMLVLLSGALSLFLSPRQKASDEEENN